MNPSDNGRNLRGVSVEQASEMLRHFESQAKRLQAEFKAFVDHGRLGTRVLDVLDKTWDENHDHLQARVNYMLSEVKYWKFAKRLLEAEQKPIDVSEKVAGKAHLQLTIFANHLEIQVKHSGRTVSPVEIAASFPTGQRKQAKLLPNGTYRVEGAVPMGGTIKLSVKRLTPSDGFVIFHERKRAETQQGRVIGQLRNQLSLARQEVETRERHKNGTARALALAGRQAPVATTHRATRSGPQKEQERKTAAKAESPPDSLVAERERMMEQLKRDPRVRELERVSLPLSLWGQLKRDLRKELPEVLEFLITKRHVLARDVTLRLIQTCRPSRDYAVRAICWLGKKLSGLEIFGAAAELGTVLLEETIGMVTGRIANLAWEGYQQMEKTFGKLAQMSDVGCYSGVFSATTYEIEFCTLYVPYAKMIQGSYYGEAVTVVTVMLPTEGGSATAASRAPWVIDMLNDIKRSPNSTITRVFWYPVHVRE